MSVSFQVSVEEAIEQPFSKSSFGKSGFSMLRLKYDIPSITMYIEAHIEVCDSFYEVFRTENSLADSSFLLIIQLTQSILIGQPSCCGHRKTFHMNRSKRAELIPRPLSSLSTHPCSVLPSFLFFADRYFRRRSRGCRKDSRVLPPVRIFFPSLVLCADWEK